MKKYVVYGLVLLQMSGYCLASKKGTAKLKEDLALELKEVVCITPGQICSLGKLQSLLFDAMCELMDNDRAGRFVGKSRKDLQEAITRVKKMNESCREMMQELLDMIEYLERGNTTQVQQKLAKV